MTANRFYRNSPSMVPNVLPQPPKGENTRSSRTDPDFEAYWRTYDAQLAEAKRRRN
jgi:hypothetical protein